MAAPLRVPGATVTVERAPAVTGDPALLRFAVATLVARCEGASLERSMIETSAVYAMALHSGGLVVPESQGAVAHYVLQLAVAT